MQRRTLLTRATALGVAGPALAAASAPAQAADFERYTESRHQALLESGEPFMLDFYASW